MLLHTKFLPDDVIAMTVFPFILVNKRHAEKVDDIVIAHEKIHLRQQIELLILPFYVWYGVEYLIHLINFRDKNIAYRSISFEREAYANDGNLNYLSSRTPFSFLKFL
jgi:hypothetical protein